MYTAIFSVERPVLTRWSVNVEHATLSELTAALTKRLGEAAKPLSIKKGPAEHTYQILNGTLDVGHIRAIKHTEPPAPPKPTRKRKPRFNLKSAPKTKKKPA